MISEGNRVECFATINGMKSVGPKSGSKDLENSVTFGFETDELAADLDQKICEADSCKTDP